MHVPDGFLDAPTSIATGVIAAGTVVVALRRARTELDERTAPMAGLVAAFVFAVQMLNFPVGVGTSGHLMGGALAAVLVGPWTAILVMTVVLAVQALLFADGGLTALGSNIVLMGIVTVAVGWTVARLIVAVLPKRPASVVPASFVGALLSVPVAAAVFVLLFAIGGSIDLSLSTLMAYMVGWHVLIGIGEGIITAATVGAVVAVRPDLVYLARGLQPRLLLKRSDGSEVLADAPAYAGAGEPRGVGRFAVVAIGVTLVLAGIASFYASPNPDGLEYVAGEQGFLDSAAEHTFGSLALADYGEVGGIPVGVAGLIGVGTVLLLGWVIFRIATSRRTQAADDQPVPVPAQGRD